MTWELARAPALPADYQLEQIRGEAISEARGTKLVFVCAVVARCQCYESVIWQRFRDVPPGSLIAWIADGRIWLRLSKKSSQKQFSNVR
jgi:hypothetical protein